ncbi:Hypothetical predicted protein [Cloeon dipterum]|uniref:Uncharacterized protein n=1 Tax=Cloeon dipterum TaxID=197152 RepID=A0A8S1CZZ9_9INSE|nr:Hypothetical predicted protein [Cloeon dipterum]
MKRKYSLLLVGTLLGLMKLWKILETRASSSGALNLVCHHLEDSLVKVDQQEVFQVLKVSNQEVFQEGNQGAFQVDNQEASLVDNQGAFQVDNQEASLEDNQEAFQEDNQEVFQGDSQDFFQVNSKEAIQVDNLVRLEDNIQVARGAAFLPEAINLALDNILAVVAFILVAVQETLLDSLSSQAQASLSIHLVERKSKNRNCGDQPTRNEYLLSTMVTIGTKSAKLLAN